MRLIILSVLTAFTWAAPMSQDFSLQDDGSYRFYYETGQEGGRHSRSETRSLDGVVVGKYSYEDPSGNLREVNYRADNSGYVATGDVSVEGAPKSQFPAVTVEETEDKPAEEEAKTEKPANPEPAKDEVRHANILEETLALGDPVEEGPPEAFPEGFFLKFQGLRRLPDPAEMKKADVPAEAPKQGDQETRSEEPRPETHISSSSPKDTEFEHPPFPNFVAPLIPLRPFHRISPQDWTTVMFHQPVYIFTYQQADAYGYHYVF